MRKLLQSIGILVAFCLVGATSVTYAKNDQSVVSFNQMHQNQQVEAISTAG
jgi:hypothetical protein